jgi:hypothetical protein
MRAGIARSGARPRDLDPGLTRGPSRYRKIQPSPV